MYIANKDSVDYDDYNNEIVKYKKPFYFGRVNYQPLTRKDLEAYIREYREKIENEITKNCQNVITIVENDLLKKASETESKVFYIKMKADYNRFICEYAVGDLKEKVLKDALTCYQEADNLAKELPVLNITSLGLSLNYCVFYYEAMNDTKFAIKIVDNAYEKVSKEFNNIDENAEENKNVIAIIRLIKENLDMWKSEVEEALKSKNTK